MKQLNADIQASKFLGLFSLALGVFELAASRQITRTLGLPVDHRVVQAFGAREMLAGFTVLAHPDNVAPMAMRIGGDALDLAVLGAALMPGNRKRPAALLATAAVVAVTLMDFGAAMGLRARDTRALATARRTRIKTISA